MKVESDVIILFQMAINQAIKEYFNFLKRLDREDIKSELMLHLLTKWNNYHKILNEKNRGRLWEWAKTVIKKRIIDYNRKALRTTKNISYFSNIEIIADNRFSYTQDVSISIEDTIAIHKLINDSDLLSDIEKEIIINKYYNNLSNRAIAKILNTSEKTIRNKLKKLLSVLKQELTTPEKRRNDERKR